MPYEYRNGYVVNKATGKPMNKKRYPNKAAAMPYMRALYAHMPVSEAFPGKR